MSWKNSKGNIKWRIVHEFKTPSEKIIGDFYPLPYINDIFDWIRSARYISVFDLATGFHHTKIDLKDSQKIVFSTRRGHYEFDRVPFRLKNSQKTLKY